MLPDFVFFHGLRIAVLGHALTKEGVIPDTEIQRTIKRKEIFARHSYEEEELNAKVARMIYEARTKAGLTQQQLAKRVGTTQTVIARLEDAEYRGHALTMLHRIARALNGQLEIQLISGKGRLKAA